MPVSLIPSFLLYALVCEISPGPVNLYALSAGVRCQRRQLGGYILGTLSGFFVVMAVSVALTLTLGELLQRYVGVLSYVGAAYILYLAYGILRSQEEGTAAAGAPTFRTGFLLQTSNIKTFLFCVTTLSAYVLPYTRSPAALLLCGAALPLSGLLCTLVWLLAGSALQGFLSRCRRLFNSAMAAVLAVCAVQLMWQ